MLADYASPTTEVLTKGRSLLLPEWAVWAMGMAPAVTLVALNKLRKPSLARISKILLGVLLAVYSSAFLYAWSTKLGGAANYIQGGPRGTLGDLLLAIVTPGLFVAIWLCFLRKRFGWAVACAGGQLALEMWYSTRFTF